MTGLTDAGLRSKKLKKFLRQYFEETDKETSEQAIKAFAQNAFSRLDRIIRMGQRKEVPSKAELEAIAGNREVALRVYLIDGTFKTLQVKPLTGGAKPVTDARVLSVG